MLTEYYKTYEPIAKTLEGDGGALRALKTYGLTKQAQLDIKRLCNDQMLQPTVLCVRL